MSITSSRRKIGAALAGAALFATGGVIAVNNLAAAQDEAAAKSDATCYADGSDGGWTHPFGFPQPKAGDVRKKGFNVAIEIPQGSFAKYEIDADTGSIVVDRFQSMPVAYPGNYGSISQSQGGDGDPLDALVVTREPIAPGSNIRVKAIGVLKMVDGGEPDDKIVAVPTGDVDPDFADINSIGDLPDVEADRIEAFFRVYKDLPTGRKKVELDGYRSARAATNEVSRAIRTYQEACS